MSEQHRSLQVEGSATSVWLQTRSLSTPHGIFVASAPRNDVKHVSAFSRQAFARGLQFRLLPPPSRAQGRPGARRTRGLMCKCASKKCAHEHTGEAETLRPSLRNGFTTYTRSLVAMLCHHRRRDAKHHRQLDASLGASGPHDFAVRIGAARLATQRVHRSLPQRQ
jgi:hypothetical protein